MFRNYARFSLSLGLWGLITWVCWQAASDFPESKICQVSENTGYEHCAGYLTLFEPFVQAGVFVENHEGFFLVLFTVALAIATVGLWWSTNKLWEAGENQMRLAGRSVDLAEKQHGLTRNQFFATHRPRLRVRLVMFNQRIQGQPLALQCEIANIGDSEATIERGEIELHVDAGPGILDAKEIGGNRRILAGESIHSIATLAAVYMGDWDLVKPMERKIRISGFVVYKDVLGTRRKTAFWRLYDHGRNGFFAEHPVNTDREYED